MPEPHVMGLDLSLASTGVASSRGWVARIHSRPHSAVSTLARLRTIRDQAMDHVRRADLVVVEGLSFGSKTGQHLTRAGLWHLVMDAIDAAGIRWAEVAPGAVKRYATGKGSAGKDEVLAAVVRRFPTVEVTGNDEADALILAAMGADHLGHPMLAMPAAHRTALDKFQWPVKEEG